MHQLLSSKSWRAWSLATKLQWASLPSRLLGSQQDRFVHIHQTPDFSSSKHWKTLSVLNIPYAFDSFTRTMATHEHPPVVQSFLQANEKYSANFTKGSLPLPPGKKVAVLACMDARLDPAKALGLEASSLSFL
jgi:hypothetical protein